MPKDTCVWCDEQNLSWNRSFNGKDICNDCEEKALEAIMSDPTPTIEV